MMASTTSTFWWREARCRCSSRREILSFPPRAFPMAPCGISASWRSSAIPNRRLSSALRSRNWGCIRTSCRRWGTCSRAASEQTQIIVTTHSDILVDTMTETPEAVVVCSKKQGQTTMERLNPDDLGEWLKKYRLGQLWTKGEIGGTRW